MGEHDSQPSVEEQPEPPICDPPKSHIDEKDVTSRTERLIPPPGSSQGSTLNSSSPESLDDSIDQYAHTLSVTEISKAVGVDVRYRLYFVSTAETLIHPGMASVVPKLQLACSVMGPTRSKEEIRFPYGKSS